ncbi:unnamed protein product [Clavelina lepadiformis]|uniref:RRM domain-containing protein n=1 Tax=Clavelina lepadiformis TaxID=159417 RepID=A0ABP0GGL4_CLALP
MNKFFRLLNNMDRSSRYASRKNRFDDFSYSTNRSPGNDMQSYSKDRRISVLRDDTSRTLQTDEYRNKPPTPIQANYDDDDDGTIYFSDCVLLPPNLDDKAMVPKTPKPKGCKTIYIGGIPDVLCRIPRRLENIFNEVFTANGGEIETVRLHGRSFCHIRFMEEVSIEKAMTVCGYYMVVQQGYEPSIKFRVTIDYSVSKADADDYEKKNLISKTLNVELKDLPNIPIFTSSSSDILMADLKKTEKLHNSIIVLRYWMEKYLDRHTAVRFFNLLQVSSNQIRQFQKEKQQMEVDCKTLVDGHCAKVEKMNKDFNHLMQVYEQAHKQKNWDLFTKPQRKSIDGWLSSVMDAVKANKREITYFQKDWKSKDKIEEADSSKDKASSAQITALQQNVAYMQQQIWEMARQLQTKEEELKSKQTEIEKLTSKVEELEDLPPKKKVKQENNIETQVNPASAKVICALAMLLQVYPNGATLECIESYLEECNINISVEDMEATLFQLGDLFQKQITISSGKTIARWKYIMSKDR